MADLMDFGTALRWLKYPSARFVPETSENPAAPEAFAAGKVARQGWNGTGMWITLSPGHSDLPPERIWSQVIREHAEAKGSNMTFRPYLMLLTADGEMVPWVATQTDLLAEDWYVA